MMLEFGVEMWFSPSQLPRYNGAIEAGIGSLKMRTERRAAEAAAVPAEANATARPRGETGPTHNELWQTRPEILAGQRNELQARGARASRGERPRRDQPGSAVAGTGGTRLYREAIRRALVEHGSLLFTRRRIPVPISGRKTAKIT